THPTSRTLFPYTTLFRSDAASTTSTTSLGAALAPKIAAPAAPTINVQPYTPPPLPTDVAAQSGTTLQGMTASSGIGLEPTVYLRSEEHTSELQSLAYLVC